MSRQGSVGRYLPLAQARRSGVLDAMRPWRFPAARAGLWLIAVLAMPREGSPDSLSAEGRALREMLLARGNLREAREGRVAPRLAQQGIGRWLQPVQQNASRPQQAPAAEGLPAKPERRMLPGVPAQPPASGMAGPETGASDACDAKVRHLDAVLQGCGLSRSKLLGLLQSVGGDVSAAANLYLDAQASGSIPALLTGIENAAAAAVSWHSGSACALEQWRGSIFAGNRAVCKWEGQWPMKMASLHVVAYLTRSLREGFLAPGATLKLYRPPVPEKFLKSAVKRQISRIVRFSAEARIPSRVHMYACMRSCVRASAPLCCVWIYVGACIWYTCI